MKNLLAKFAGYRRDCILAPAFKLLEALLELLVPVLVADVVDRGMALGDAGVVARDVALIVLCGAVGLAFSIAGQYFAAHAATGFAADSRAALYKKLLSAPNSVTDRIGVSAMVTRMTSDVNRMQTGVNLALRLVLRSPFVVLGALVCAFLIDAKAALVFAAVIVVLAVIVLAVLKASMPRYGAAQKKLDEVSLVARENLTGARVIRAFGAEEREEKSFSDKSSAFERAQNAAGRISALLNPLTFVAVNLAIVALLWTGAIRVDGGFLTKGAVIALYDYMSQILVELVKFANLIVTVSRALACAKRVESVLASEETLAVAGGEKGSEAYIEYRGVSVTYGDGTRALIGADLAIERGQTIGIIGGTGSGKSTLAGLLVRFYDATGGTLFFEGKDIRSYSPAYMREKVALALQRPTIFRGTVRENVKFGADMPDERVKYALSVAQAKDFVDEKGGLDCAVEQGGKNFSGGQRQRLALARAIARKPDVLVLDDSSSALDYATDLALRRAIKALDYKPTVVIVSQRTASVKGADKIVVLDEGRIVGTGTHAELMETCEVYKEIELSQTKGAKA